MAQRYLIGVDLGGTKILSAVYDEKFNLLGSSKAKTKPQKDEKYFLDTIDTCIDNALQEANVERRKIIGMGVGCTRVSSMSVPAWWSNPPISIF